MSYPLIKNGGVNLGVINKVVERTINGPETPAASANGMIRP